MNPEYKDHFLVSGFAHTPKGTPINETYKYIGVILVINKKTTEIVECDFSVVSELTNKFLKEIIIGYHLNRPFSELEYLLKSQMNIPSLGAILQALKAAIERYTSSSIHFIK